MLTKISKLLTCICLLTATLCGVPCGNFVGEIAGEQNGGIFSPASIAIAESGKVYIIDAEQSAVLVFDRCGNFLFKFGGTLLDDPVDLAISQENLVYVADINSNRVQVFDSCGNFLFTIGEGILNAPSSVAVGPGGKIYVGDRNPMGNFPRIQVFDRCGNLLFGTESSTIIPSGIQQLAISPQGLVYGTTPKGVVIFDECLNFVGGITFLPSFAPFGIAFHSDGSFAIAVLNEGMDTDSIVTVYNRCGNALFSFGQGEFIFQGLETKLAFSPLGLLYVCDSGNGRVAIFQ